MPRQPGRLLLFFLSFAGALHGCAARVPPASEAESKRAPSAPEQRPAPTVPASPSADGSSDTEFAARYPNPQIHRSWPAPQGSFRIIEVYDRSQLNEDPIGTSLWIEHADGRKRPLSTEAVSDIVRRQGIVPSTEKQAWDWATLFVRCENYLSPAAIWEPGSPVPAGVPPELMQGRPPRSVRQVEGGWELAFSVVKTPKGFGGRRDPFVYVSDWKVTIRSSELRYEQRDVWPAMDKARPMSLSSFVRQALPRMFTPAPALASAKLELDVPQRVALGRRTGTLKWTSVNLESSDDLGASFDVVLTELRSGAKASFAVSGAPGSESLPIALGELIVVASVEHGDAFHKDPAQLRLALSVMERAPYLLCFGAFSSPVAERLRADQVIERGALRPARELFAELSPQDKARALEPLTFVPEIDDEQRFAEFFASVIRQVPKPAVSRWLKAHAIAQPLLEYWASGARSPAALTEQVANQVSGSPALFTLALQVAADSQDAKLMDALKRALDATMNRYGLVDPPPYAMENHLERFEQWSKIRSVTLPQAESMLKRKRTK